VNLCPHGCRPGKFKTGLADNGDMWIDTLLGNLPKAKPAESYVVLSQTYQRLLVAGK
jgi:hypothetical protein